MPKYIKLLFTFISIILFLPMNSMAGSIGGCENIGMICNTVKNHSISDVYEVNKNGYKSKIVLKYSIKQLLTTDGGQLLTSNIENIDVKEVKIDVTLNNCLDNGGCGVREFQNYIDSQGTYGSLLFQTLFTGSADRVAKTAFDKYTQRSFGLTVGDLYSVIKGLLTNLSRPVYVRFLSSDGKALGWIKLGLNSDGTIKIAEELLYGIDNGDYIIHGSPGVLSRDDWLRDYTFVFHTIKSCFDKIINITDPNGSSEQVKRTVCIYTSKVEFVPN